ncbi:MAG: hypothetical protein OHK006_00960 [Thermodesulfovibrionales bacterium]
MYGKEFWFFLFFFGTLLMNWPFLVIFGMSLPVYFFFVWALLIFITGFAAHTSSAGKDV